jgi:hypothetical protein
MTIFFVVLSIIGIVFLGLIIAAELHQFTMDHASTRSERTRINLETVRAERELHRIASDAFMSMMEVTRLTDATSDIDQQRHEGDDAE